MTKQRHVIKKCIVELDVPYKDKTFELQQKIGNIINNKLAELIEKYCSEYSAENVLHRLEKMEIDLGQLPAENLEQELIKRFEIEFSRTLQQVVSDYKDTEISVDKNLYKSKQELLEFFITTGSLPWWADAKNKHLLTDAVSELFEVIKNKEKLFKLVLQENKYLLRLINHIPDELLDDVPQLPSKELKDFYLQMFDFIFSGLKKMKSMRQFRESRIRQTIWSAIYKSSYNYIGVEGLITLVLKNISDQAGFNLKTFSSGFFESIKNRKDHKLFKPFNSALKELSKTITDSEQIEKTIDPVVETTIDKKLFTQVLNLVSSIKDSNFSPDEIKALLNQLLASFPKEITQEVYYQLQLLEEYHNTARITFSSIKKLTRELLDQSEEEYLRIHNIIKGAKITDRKLAEFIEAYIDLLKNKWFAPENLDKPVQTIGLDDYGHNIFLSLFIEFKQSQDLSNKAYTKELFKRYLYTYFENIDDNNVADIVKSLTEVFKLDDTKPGNIREFLNLILEHIVDINFTGLLNSSKTFPEKLPEQNKEENLKAILKTFFQSSIGKVSSVLIAKVIFSEKKNVEAGNILATSKLLKENQGKLQKNNEQLVKTANELATKVKQLEEELLNQIKKNKLKKKELIHHSGEDEIFITNAGLVLIAPFIRYLFIALEYVDEQHQFKTVELQHRAVLLLQYLCTPFNETFEYLLPLCKIICGLSPDELVDIEFKPSEKEASECEDLIKIVIERAAIFKNLSNDGFRGSFLLREGKLSLQNNSWLLQVEKKTHDILLEKIPWNYKIVKLPWMNIVLQVEW